MAGPRRNDVDSTGEGPSGGDPYRVQGNRVASGVSADAVLRLFVVRDAAYAIDDVGRVHVFDGAGMVTASVPIGPFADAAVHDGGAALAIAAFGKGVTSIAGSSADARRFLAHPFPVVACAGGVDGLVVGDQAGEVTLLLPEMGAAQATSLKLRAPILSIATAGGVLAVLTADGEALTGTWPRVGALTSVRGLRAKRPYRVLGQGQSFVVLDRERVHAIRGDEVVHTSRDFPEGILGYASMLEGGWLLTDAGRLHHLDKTLRASPAINLGVSGRPRGVAAINGPASPGTPAVIGERAAVWTTRGELVLASRDDRVRVVTNEGVLAATSDARNGDLVALHGTRGLALRRHPPS